MSYYPSSKPARTPLQMAARTANVWGWSYILTVLGVFGAWSVPPGPLRFLLLNLGILCTFIGVLELVWRHYLVKTGEACWAKILALNQVAGTLSLLWSLYLVYKVPEALFYAYAKTSAMWNNVINPLKASSIGYTLTDAYILHVWHITKIIFIYGVGGILILSQIWVIYHYLSMARAIEQTPPTPANVPPILK